MIRFLKHILVIFFGLAVLFVFLVWIAGTVEYHESGDAEFDEKFATIKTGDSKTKVIELLGKPEWEDKEFRLGQREGFEEAYKRAENSGSDHYIFWRSKSWSTIVYSVGLNKDKKVTIVESGGT